MVAKHYVYLYFYHYKPLSSTYIYLDIVMFNSIVHKFFDIKSFTFIYIRLLYFVKMNLTTRAAVHAPPPVLL